MFWNEKCFFCFLYSFAFLFAFKRLENIIMGMLVSQSDQVNGINYSWFWKLRRKLNGKLQSHYGGAAGDLKIDFDSLWMVSTGIINNHLEHSTRLKIACGRTKQQFAGDAFLRFIIYSNCAINGFPRFWNTKLTRGRWNTILQMEFYCLVAGVMQGI